MTTASPTALRGGSGQDGFTLLEIMIGLLVSMLIMTGLAAAMKSMDMGWRSTVAVLDKKDLFADGYHIIAGDLSRIERMGDKIENPERFLFRGARTEAVFILAERPASNKGGLYWVKLFTRSDDRGTELVRMRAPFTSRVQDFAGIEWRDAVVLLKGSFAIGFSYRAPQSGFPAWTGSWDIANRLPEQIRVEVLDPESGQPAMPALVQSLDNNAEVSCIDPKDTGCTVRSKGELVPKTSSE